ncbi:unnamed protein product [Staurois parvus]|uniref:CCHC-type domain-containing protein n=1 Tax=Staurois parvus TaxID=386267 RepID=A0ABN9E5A4_9NEOB|nr:unnamed protein product [Staurois parvus]
MEESVQDNTRDFPPLVESPPASQGNSGPSGHVPPRNAWSRGAPSFSNNTGYTGQAFKRRNVVRLKHRGSREELPDRRFVVRELLCQQMGFVPADILAVINLPDRRGYDVSFKLMSGLDRFWAGFSGFRDKEGWKIFTFIPISKPDTANVNIIFWNESVPPQDIVVWLRRHCEMVSDLTKTRDSDGIWTGGWRVLVKLRQSNNVTHHLPNSFFIGRERGVCFYAGQPRLCFKCGRSGHVASVCSIMKCNLCGEVGHVSSTCENIKCNLCGRLGHLHRDCPVAFHNRDEESVDEEFLVAAEHLEEEALMNGVISTEGEVNPEVQGASLGQEGSVQQTEEQRPSVAIPSISVPASVENIPRQKRRNRKDKATRKPESEWTRVQKSVKKVRRAPEGSMAVGNQYDVLSESDANSCDLEDQMEEEVEGNLQLVQGRTHPLRSARPRLPYL